MSISLDIREWCDEADVDGNACDELRAIADRIDREMEEKERLKKENAELAAELDDWKGNAEGFQPDAYMRLPLDADGVPIRIGDKVNVDGEAMTVLGYRLYSGTLFLIVKEIGSNNTYSPKPSSVRHFKYVPPDSWEKLEEDARKTACNYAPAPRNEDGLVTCYGCRFENNESCSQEMRLDILKRAKKLAGIEEGGAAMSACEYCKPYSEASVDKRDRFGTGFVVAVDATAPCMSVECDDHGAMVESGIVEISNCPFCGRKVVEP